MRIHRITLRNYRGTVERTLEFRDGVTVVEGRNEVGKSTWSRRFGTFAYTRPARAGKRSVTPSRWDGMSAPRPKWSSAPVNTTSPIKGKDNVGGCVAVHAKKLAHGGIL